MDTPEYWNLKWDNAAWHVFDDVRRKGSLNMKDLDGVTRSSRIVHIHRLIRSRHLLMSKDKSTVRVNPRWKPRKPRIPKGVTLGADGRCVIGARLVITTHRAERWGTSVTYGIVTRHLRTTHKGVQVFEVLPVLEEPGDEERNEQGRLGRRIVPEWNHFSGGDPIEVHLTSESHVHCGPTAMGVTDDVALYTEPVIELYERYHARQ